MAITWQLRGIKSVDPNTMRIMLIEVVDGVTKDTHSKTFPKTATQEQVLTQFAQIIKQKRTQEISDRVPFNVLDLSNFETRVNNS